MPRTLLGDALTADGGASGVAPADRVSEDVVLIAHDFNCNEAMRALVESLFVIQERPGQRTNAPLDGADVWRLDGRKHGFQSAAFPCQSTHQLPQKSAPHENGRPPHGRYVPALC